MRRILKRIAGLLICLVIVASQFTAPAYAAEISENQDRTRGIILNFNIFLKQNFGPVFMFRLGDFNVDGRITAADARSCLRMAAGLDKLYIISRMAGDVNGDGKMTAADARLILRASAGLDKIPDRTVNAEIDRKYTFVGLKSDENGKWYVRVDNQNGYEMSEGVLKVPNDTFGAYKDFSWQEFPFTFDENGIYNVTYEYKSSENAEPTDSFTVKYIADKMPI